MHAGDMFAGAKATGETLKGRRLLTPCEPSKMVCLWNNFHQLAAKNDFPRAERTAVVPEGAECLSSRQWADPPPVHL